MPCPLAEAIEAQRIWTSKAQYVDAERKFHTKVSQTNDFIPPSAYEMAGLPNSISIHNETDPFEWHPVQNSVLVLDFQCPSTAPIEQVEQNIRSEIFVT